MNDKGNRYALSALRDKRATIAAEIVQLERQLRHRREALVHVDATLRLFDPSVHVEAIPNKRIPQRIKLFRQGELGRMILDAMRQLDRPASTAEIVTEILQAGGHGESARRTVRPRVRGNLAYLSKRGMVQKLADGKAAKWVLA